MARVTGIGGIFIRAKDPKALSAWYAENLGIEIDATHGAASMMWTDEIPKGTGVTAWSTFPADTDYFGVGSTQAVMINYRVDDLDAILEKLAAVGTTIDPKRQEAGYGKFAWIVDPEGNRIELWQPLVYTPE